jgi:heme A synthase
MLSHIHYLARISVARACGFAMIGLATVVIGLSNRLEIAFAVGGCMCLIACLILALKAIYADQRSYNRTEVWLMLDPADRPRAEFAQQVISIARRDAFLNFAHYAAWLGAGQLTASLVMQAFLLR